MAKILLRSFEAIRFPASVSRVTAHRIDCRSGESFAWAAAPDADVSVGAVASDTLADHGVVVLAGIDWAHHRGALRCLRRSAGNQHGESSQQSCKLVHGTPIRSPLNLDAMQGYFCL